jgi:hypothetical protein
MIDADIKDTLLISGAQDAIVAEYLNVLGGEGSELVTNSNGVWQFDLDASGSIDLVVNDAIHRISFI